jgi:diguanylate cyclase (GGDEF)-like protein
VISRIGGDEFIIILNEINDVGALENVIIKILDAFRNEWVVQGHFLRLSVSIGAAVYPDDSRDINELMKYADIALYKAKAEGRDQFSFFTSELNTKIHEGLRLPCFWQDGNFSLSAKDRG